LLQSLGEVVSDPRDRRKATTVVNAYQDASEVEIGYDAVALEKFILRNLRVSKARATMEEKRVAL
jgi:hypothetical protein